MRRFSFPTIVAVILGVFVLAGGALAAGHYLITNIHQIKPSVLHQLRGQQGSRGLTGPQGASGSQGSQGPQGVPGAAGTARAVAVVNSDGTLLQGVGFPKNVTGVSHTPGSGIYCIGLAGGINPGDAMATLTDDSDLGAQVNSVPRGPDCASGQAEINTFQLQDGGSTAGTPLQEVFADEGFVVLVP